MKTKVSVIMCLFLIVLAGCSTNQSASKTQLATSSTVSSAEETTDQRKLIQAYRQPLNLAAIAAIEDLRHESYFGENSPLVSDESGNYLRKP